MDLMRAQKPSLLLARLRRTQTSEPVAAPKSPRQAVWVGVEAALLGWGSVVAAGLLAFIGQALAGQEASWFRAVQISTAVWASALGSPLLGVEVPVPLALTGLIWWVLTGFLRRSQLTTWAALGTAVAGFGATVVALLVLAWGAASPLWTLTGAAGVSLAAVAAAAATIEPLAAAAREWAGPYAETTLRFLRVCGALWRALTLLGMGAALGMILWRWSAVADTWQELGTGVAGGVALAIVQLAFLPTLGMWALAWLAGPGFRIASLSAYTPHSVLPGEQSPVPVLSAVPLWQPGLWVALTLVALGAWVGVRHEKRYREEQLPAGRQILVLLGAAVSLTAMSLVLALVVERAAVGALAPGTLFAAAGPLPGGMVLAVLWSCLGLTLGLLAASPTVRGVLARQIRLTGQDVATTGRVSGQALRRRLQRSRPAPPGTPHQRPSRPQQHS